MKTGFKFCNLLGTVYCRGNLVFTPDGTSLLSPVGNRVTVFDLVNNKSYTLPFSHRKNVVRFALNPRGNLLLSIDESGHVILANFPRRIALHHFSIKGGVSALSFSPCGRFFAVGNGRLVAVWRTPSAPESASEEGLEFAPFVRHHVHAGHHDVVQSIEWSSDSRFFLSASKDLTAQIWSVNPEEGFFPTTLAGHRECLLDAWFSSDQEAIYTISQDGALFRWEYIEKPPPIGGTEAINDELSTARWRIVQKHFFMQKNAKMKCAAYHPGSNLLVAGFANGIFGLYELPEFNLIHMLSVSQSQIDFVSINKTGEWLAFGASKLGQLLVWEWQSESYILKQQGHFDSMNALTYSRDGQRIITTADDGKIKVWDTQSGFCTVTFTEHSSGVTACEFSRRGNVLFTSSLDGSVRAWDLIRYRNFRTFTAPARLSFSSVAIDPSDEIVCAGSLDSFEIYVWSVQTGQLLDQLAGHEGPISSLAFAPSGDTIISGSWDYTVRIWSIFGRSQTSEPLQMQAEVLHVAFRPDSKQIAVSTLDGQLAFWSVFEASQELGVDARRDVSGGRKLMDRRTAANVAGTKSFNCVAYSADGACVIAGGNSKYICLYDVQTGVLLKKYTVSTNISVDGTREFLNSRDLTEAGPAGLVDDQGEASELEDRIDRTLPGASRGDPSARRTPLAIRVPAIAFSPNGRGFCAATTEGLLIYSLDTALPFDPFDLDMDVTPANTFDALDRKDYLRALNLPRVYLARILRFVAHSTEESPHLEFNLRWIEALLSVHGPYLRDSSTTFTAELRTVQKAIVRIQADLARLADENSYTLDYLLSQPARVREKGQEQVQLLINGHEQEGIRRMNMDEEWIGLDDGD